MRKTLTVDQEVYDGARRAMKKASNLLRQLSAENVRLLAENEALRERSDREWVSRFNAGVTAEKFRAMVNDV